jgi:hypothetical protein
MKLTFESVEDKKRFKTEPNKVRVKYDDAPGDGSCGTAGNPTNHFPSARIRMHELQKAESDPLVDYRVITTNY